MEEIYGLALMSASVLGLFYGAKFRNAPNAADWLKSGIVMHTVIFSTVVGFVFGLSLVVDFMVHFSTAEFGFTDIGLLGVIVAVNWLGWIAIRKTPISPAANNNG